MKKILIVAATQFEVQPFINFLQQAMLQKKHPIFSQYSYEIFVTGVGMVNTTLKLYKQLSDNKYDLVLNVGVAGSFDANLPKGSVVEVVAEEYGDFGAENADGSMATVFELGLLDGEALPFTKNRLLNPTPLNFRKLEQVLGLTVQMVHGSKARILKVSQKFKDVHIETMEGAAFFQTCLQLDVNFAQIRAVSNFVEPRNKENWQLDLAVENLKDKLVELFQTHII
jgi:futalosine hydrolase